MIRPGVEKCKLRSLKVNADKNNVMVLGVRKGELVGEVNLESRPLYRPRKGERI